MVVLAGRYSTFLLLLIISIIWSAAFFYYGLCFTPDSGEYLQVASFMFHQGEYNTSLTTWPPLYPFVVHLFMIFTPYPTAAAGLASGFLLFGTLLFIALALKKALHNPGLEFVVFVALLSFVCIWEPYYHVFSETLFLLCCVANLFFVYQYLDTKKLVYFFLAAASASCAALTRYIGYCLLLNFFLVIFYILAKESNVKKKMIIFVGGILSFLPSIGWALRNYHINETFHGVRRTTGVTMLESIHYYVKHMDAVMGDPLLILVIAAFIFFGYRLRNLFQKKQKANVLTVFEIYVLGFGILYSIVLIYMSSRSNLNLIGNRLLHPVYPLLMMFCGLGLAQAREFTTKKNVRTIVSICCAFALLTGAIENANSLSKTFFKISKVATGSNRITAVGFEKNPNAVDMARYFHKVLENHSRILVATIDNKKRDARSHYGYGFYSRRVMWNNPHISNMRIVNLPHPIDERTREGKLRSYDFNAYFKYKKSSKQVFYRGLPKSVKLSALAKNLKHMMKDENATCAFIIESYVDDKKNTAIAMGRKVNEKKQVSGLEVTTVFNRQHFAVHQFVFPSKQKSTRKENVKK